ncbi:GNAT family N-acetyltransferase [Vibrio tritonius]|uniref:GNAT family N-acetyltransferase n=1 Tax=Vibrio tritonius TaxID=1435069 RepID=A0ABS7YUX7_9VIBR|nr:GNAT family N-acetyltransferase [Vibrio tritonius]MCA2018867.1 GNAT family N-acetyltransferase [Vibrio tritonius]
MSCVIEPLTARYDQNVRQIIEQVGAEFGAVGEGYGPSDPEVLCMSQHYGDASKSLYLIALLDGKVVGGCGLASFNDSPEVCELKKLFILPEGRGHGLGKRMAITCLDYARTQGYQSCYLDTLTSMKVAVRLYESLGFCHLNAPLAGTLHNSCDVWMLKSLL